jgi:hypothetical protein
VLEKKGKRHVESVVRVNLDTRCFTNTSLSPTVSLVRETLLLKFNNKVPLGKVFLYVLKNDLKTTDL